MTRRRDIRERIEEAIEHGRPVILTLDDEVLRGTVESIREPWERIGEPIELSWARDEERAPLVVVGLGGSAGHVTREVVDLRRIQSVRRVGR